MLRPATDERTSSVPAVQFHVGQIVRYFDPQWNGKFSLPCEFRGHDRDEAVVILRGHAEIVPLNCLRRT